MKVCMRIAYFLANGVNGNFDSLTFRLLHN